MNLGLFPDGVDLDAAALHMARLAGCTCDPDVEVRDGIAAVSHDGWCPLLARIERRN